MYTIHNAEQHLKKELLKDLLQLDVRELIRIEHSYFCVIRFKEHKRISKVRPLGGENNLLNCPLCSTVRRYDTADNLGLKV